MSYADAEPLPFNPLAHGWPDRWDGPDYRPILDWYVEYAWPVPCRCTYCWRLGDDSFKECVTIKIQHASMPLGYLESRCPAHPAPERRAAA